MTRSCHLPAGHIRGLTIAAAIWAVGSVGVIAGAARTVLAIAITVLFVFVIA